MAMARRRRHGSHESEFGVDVCTGSVPVIHVKCTDISLGGCYLETCSPLPVGAKLTLSLRLANGNVSAMGEVRSMDPAFGMGIEFVNVDCPEVLESYIRDQSRQPASASQSDNQIECEDQAAKTAGGGGTEAHTDGVAGQSQDPYRVLLADNSKCLRSAYSTYLEREGYEVTFADNGEQAVQLARTERPHVIVLDLLVFKTGGITALTVLKQNTETATIPVIVLSDLPFGNGEKLRAVGAFACVAKTQVGPEELPDVVMRALQCSGSGYLACTRGMDSAFARA
jgi:CheY-like chemotaxis protein